MGNNSDPFYGAPVILIVLADKSKPTAIYDGSLVMGNLCLRHIRWVLAAAGFTVQKEEFETAQGKEILKQLGINGEYEGIGHCALGYPDEDYPDVIPRKENRVFYIK